jgi:xanthine dehydrogenase accessory factor
MNKYAGIGSRHMKQAEYAKVMGALVSRGEPFVVATVVKTKGSSLGKPGFKVVISGAGEVLYGSLGGACPESAIVPPALKTLKTGSPKTVEVYLEDVEGAVGGVLRSQNEDEIHVETNCGGMMEIYLEPFLPPQRLILIGQGGKDEVEDALVSLGMSLDFEVVVIDHSPVLSHQPDQLITDGDFDLSKFGFQPSDSVVILTKGERDVDTLAEVGKRKLRYVGMMASRQRAADDLDKLRKKGIPEIYVESIHTPAGADIGALTPYEIGISIMAEIVAAKYGKKVRGILLKGRSQEPTL